MPVTVDQPLQVVYPVIKVGRGNLVSWDTARDVEIEIETSEEANFNPCSTDQSDTLGIKCEDHPCRSDAMRKLVQQCSARRNALELENWLIHCGDVEYSSPSVQCYFVIWRAKTAVLIRPDTTGKLRADHEFNELPEELHSRHNAIQILRNIWDKFRHLGTVPSVEERRRPAQGTPVRAVATHNRFESLCSKSEPEGEPEVAAVVIRTLEKQDLPGSPDHNITCWIGDTGCGHDLVEAQHLSDPKTQVWNTPTSLSLRTANGSVRVNQRGVVHVRELMEQIEPIVLPSTPAVLTIGARCFEQGYGFVWEPFHQHPWFILPDSTHRFDLRSHGNVPYVITGDQPYVWPGGSEFCRMWGGPSPCTCPCFCGERTHATPAATVIPSPPVCQPCIVPESQPAAHLSLIHI